MHVVCRIIAQSCILIDKLQIIDVLQSLIIEFFHSLIKISSKFNHYLRLTRILLDFVQTQFDY